MALIYLYTLSMLHRSHPIFEQTPTQFKVYNNVHTFTEKIPSGGGETNQDFVTKRETGKYTLPQDKIQSNNKVIH